MAFLHYARFEHTRSLNAHSELVEYVGVPVRTSACLVGVNLEVKDGFRPPQA